MTKTNNEIKTSEENKKILKSYYDNGYSIIPVVPGLKAPMYSGWTERRFTVDEIRKYLGETDRWGIACGKFSDGLYVIDFDDYHRPGVYEIWKGMLSKEALDFLDTCPIERSARKGRHVYMKTERVDTGNEKYAIIPTDEIDEKTGKTKFETLIESRGNGGQVVAYPTEGYKFEQLSLLDTKWVSEDILMEFEKCARFFDERQKKEPRPLKQYIPRLPEEGDRPGDIYNKQTSWEEIVSMIGAKLFSYKGRSSRGQTDMYLWKRPGKKDPGLSGKIFSQGENELMVSYSSNSLPIETDRLYDKFSLYVLYRHNGDYSSAAKELAVQYGMTNDIKLIPISFEENEEKQKEAEDNKVIYKDYVIPTIPKHYWTGSFKEVSEATGVQDWATMIGSLSAFGAIAAKDVVISESIGFQYTTSLYILSAAPSGSGKSMIVKVCSDIIKAVSELQSLEGSVKHISLLSGIESGQALQESFIQTVAGKDEKGKEKQVPSKTAKEIMVLNEEFQQVCFIMMRSGGTLETVMNDLYMKCGSYSIEKMALKRDFGATGGRIVLGRPIVSVLGTMVTSQFSLTFDNDTKRSSGMFNRFLVLPCEKKKFDDGFGTEGTSLYNIETLKESAHKFLDKVNEYGYNFTNTMSGIVFNKEAQAEYNKGGFIEDIWDGLDESNRRTGMHVKSLSVIFAIADGRGIVNAFDVERASFITKMSIETKAHLFELGREAVTVSAYDQADHAIEMNILKKIKESGGRINKRDLGFSLKSRKLSSKKIGDVISNMEREGEIVLESVDNYDEEGKKVRPSLWVSINKKDA